MNEQGDMRKNECRRNRQTQCDGVIKADPFLSPAINV